MEILAFFVPCCPAFTQMPAPAIGKASVSLRAEAARLETPSSGAYTSAASKTLNLR